MVTMPNNAELERRDWLFMKDPGIALPFQSARPILLVARRRQADDSGNYMIKRFHSTLVDCQARHLFLAGALAAYALLAGFNARAEEQGAAPVPAPAVEAPAPTEAAKTAPSAASPTPEAAPKTEETPVAEPPKLDPMGHQESKEVEKRLRTLVEAESAKPIEVKEGDGPIYVIPIKTQINTASFTFARRIIKKAQKTHARAIILDMDTPGGRVDVCLDFIQMLNKLGMPTYTYVNPNAISAGSLIAIGTRNIYMAPLSAIGASAVVGSEGEDLDKTMNDKIVSYLTAFMRTTAQRNGHNPQIVQAFINKETEVKVGDTLVNSKGTLLSLGANEAVKVIDGKPVLAVAIADNVEDLIKQAGMAGKSPVIYAEPTAFERLGNFIAMIAPLLFIIGVAGAYLEYQTPGFGLPGFISMTAFALFFFGHYIVGLAESELLVLFLLGFALVVVELLLLPGTMLPLVLGVGLILGSVFLAMLDKWPTDGSWIPDFGDITMPGIKFLLGMVGSVILISVLALYLPRTSLFGRLALAHVVGGTVLKGLDVDPGAGTSSGASASWLQTGMSGTAESRLRPAGKARFGELLVDVQSDGRFVEKGTPVRVKAINGATVTVEPV